MIDFTTLTKYFVLVVVVACLIVGYVIKHATFLKKIPNDDIPCILISSITGEGLQELKDELWAALNETPGQ